MIAGFKKLKLFLLFTSLLTYILSDDVEHECDQKSCLYHRLFGHSVAALTNLRLHECARLCSSDRRCASFNYRQENATCEMVSVTVDTVAAKYILEDEYWHHFDVNNWIYNGNQRCDDSICNGDARCIAVRNTHVCFIDTPRCADGYIQLDKKCYMITNTTLMNWDGAMTYCQSIGATLGTLRSWTESSYIYEYLRGMETTADWSYYPWMGIKFNASGDDIWSYQPDGEPVDSMFINWSPALDTDGYCGVMTLKPEPAHRAWIVIPCDVPNVAVMCERALGI